MNLKDAPVLPSANVLDYLMDRRKRVPANTVECHILDAAIIGMENRIMDGKEETTVTNEFLKNYEAWSLTK